MSTPAPIRRVVTGVDKDGASVILYDSPMRQIIGPDDGDKNMSLHQAWVAQSAPADPQPEQDGGELSMPGFMQPGGSAFKVLGIAPRARFPLHHTLSLDYVYVIEGEMQLVLADDGKTNTVLKKGDTLVQLGNAHAFVNDSDEWCRFVGVSVESLPTKPTPAGQFFA